MPKPSTFARLGRLRGQDLRSMHRAGGAPCLAELDGVLEGTVLDGTLGHPALRPLRLWRGKVFTRSPDGLVTGRNRLGVGPIEIHRFRFQARVAPSLFSDREVVLLDHDDEANPMVVRRFHDELVQVDDGLWLATSHHRSHLGAAAELRLLCHFALAAPARC